MIRHYLNIKDFENVSHGTFSKYLAMVEIIVKHKSDLGI